MGSSKGKQTQSQSQNSNYDQDSSQSFTNQQRSNQTQRATSRTSSSGTQKHDPYAAAKPNLDMAMRRADTLFKRGDLTVDAFGRMVAEQSPETLQALQQMGDIAGQGTGVADTAVGAWNDMLSGDPYANIDAVQEDALRGALPAAASYFANSGMLNSSVAGEGMAEAAMRAAAPVHSDAYHRDQNRRLQAMSMAPMMGELPYMDSQMLARVGAERDAYSQDVLSDQARAHYEKENRHSDALQRLLGLTVPVAGLGGTTTTRGTDTTTSNGYSSGTTYGSGSSTGSQSGMSFGNVGGSKQQKTGVGGVLGGILKAAPLIGGFF